jgi:DNA-binding beta-propeller fold protein YncE
MRSVRRSVLLILAVSLGVMVLPAVAQVVVATVPAGIGPYTLAVNPVTNKIYVTTPCGSDPTCFSAGTVTVIDGVTNNTITVNAGVAPWAIAVNPVTNKVYVANNYGNDPTGYSSGTVTVIDGITNNTTTVNVGFLPNAVAVNPVTNKIYVTNQCGDSWDSCGGPATVTVIDGLTNNTTSVNVGEWPWDVKINSETNKIYVVNHCLGFCQSGGTVTVIDGTTNNTLTVNVGFSPHYAAVDPVTNKIYVTNGCGNDPTCNSPGTVTVIDGATLSTTTVAVGIRPLAVAVNSATNKVYVANLSCRQAPCQGPETVTVIDGVTNNTLTVNVGVFPHLLAVDSVTNKIYVPNGCGNDLTCNSAGTVSVIDGLTNSVVPVAVGDGPYAVAVNETTDRIYVPNGADDTVSVIAGDTALQLVPVTPCRVVDTRPEHGGDGPILGGTFQTFLIPQEGGCNIPATAAAYSLNVTLVPDQGGPVGYLTIWPAGEVLRPVVSTVNSLDGRIKANAAVVPAGVSGGVDVYVTNTTDVVIDIDGYFAPASPSTLAFYPLTPCRVADTRHSSYPQGLGPPFLTGGQERAFPILNATSCNIPSSAAAYSLNFSVVPHGALYYMTVWPTGESRPVVSTLNDIPGQIIANAAIVVAGTSGEVSVYPTNDTDLVVDINGYFAPAGPGGLSLYPAVPCRVIDTRKIGNGQPFSGTLSPPVDVVDSACAPPTLAQAYVFNASVVPQGYLGYLTLWPDLASQPLVSTLNALDGSISSNMAIVPSTNGKVDAYASGLTQLILDISSYFAP